MDEILEKLNKEAKEIFLAKDEKSAIRNILISYSRKSPFINEKNGNLISPYSAFFSFSFLRNKRVLVSAFVIILLLLGGGTSYAAQQALPGDILYPIKINVSEKIADLMVFSKEAKVKLNEKIIKTRLEEMDKLILIGKFNKKTETRIEKDLKNALEKSEKRNNVSKKNKKENKDEIKHKDNQKMINL